MSVQCSPENKAPSPAQSIAYPASRRGWDQRGAMLFQHQRRWPNLTPASNLPSCAWSVSQQTRHIDLMLDQCWPTVYDVGPRPIQHWVDASCLLGSVNVTRPANVGLSSTTGSMSLVMSNGNPQPPEAQKNT